MYLFRDLLQPAAHVSSQQSVTHAALPGTLSKQIHLTTLEGSEKLDDGGQVLVGRLCRVWHSKGEHRNKTVGAVIYSYKTDKNRKAVAFFFFFFLKESNKNDVM